MLINMAGIHSTGSAVTMTTSGISRSCAKAIGHTQQIVRTSGCCSAGAVNHCSDPLGHDVCDGTVLKKPVVAADKELKSAMRCSMGAGLAIP